MVTSRDWFAEFKGKQRLTEREVNLMKKRLNEGKIKITQLRNGGYALTDDQVRKGKAWLRSKCYNAKGEIRESSNFGYREAEILDSMKSIRLMDFIDLAPYRAPPQYQMVYEVVSKEENFAYYLWNGQIVIVG